jgi:hypothetical protein
MQNKLNRGITMKFSKFMASNSGRILRVVAGAALIILGITMRSTGGYVLVLIGLLPLVAGIFDVCIFAPFFHMPLTGKAIRAHK